MNEMDEMDSLMDDPANKVVYSTHRSTDNTVEPLLGTQVNKAVFPMHNTIDTTEETLLSNEVNKAALEPIHNSIDNTEETHEGNQVNQVVKVSKCTKCIASVSAVVAISAIILVILLFMSFHTLDRGGKTPPETPISQNKPIINVVIHKCCQEDQVLRVSENYTNYTCVISPHQRHLWTPRLYYHNLTLLERSAYSRLRIELNHEFLEYDEYTYYDYTMDNMEQVYHDNAIDYMEYNDYACPTPYILQSNETFYLLENGDLLHMFANGEKEITDHYCVDNAVVDDREDFIVEMRVLRCIEDEDPPAPSAWIVAYNYTTQMFKPDSPIPVRHPTTFAFDKYSGLRDNIPPDMDLNPGLNIPGVLDFAAYNTLDVLAPLYQYEAAQKKKRQKVPKRLGASYRDPHLADKEHLQLMLENVLTLPRHPARNATLRDSIGEYIMRKMGMLGLLTGTQVFKPSQFHRMFWVSGEEIPEGSNIIGIYPGTKFGTHEDKLLLVGAHWDTHWDTDGYNDNGSGVAAVIEVARALAESKCKLKYSVIFVAFDLEEVGSQGSHELIRSYLVPKFFNASHWPEFQGAFILDTIMNFNETVGAQVIPESWRDKIPEAFQEIKEDNFKGNFISMMSRKVPEKEISEKVIKHWNKLVEDKEFANAAGIENERFKIVNFALGLGSELPHVDNLTDHVHFLRSDHTRFWYSNETDYSLSLKAVLFTDTGPYRGAMKYCYHKQCDSKRNEHRGEFANYDFLVQIVQTIIDTVTEMAGADCPASGRQQKTLTKFRDSSVAETVPEKSGSKIEDIIKIGDKEVIGDVFEEVIEKLSENKEVDEDIVDELDKTSNDDNKSSISSSGTRIYVKPFHKIIYYYVPYYFHVIPSYLSYNYMFG